MKPTKEQLADPKWWDSNAKKEDKYCYINKKIGGCLTTRHSSDGVNAWQFLAKRPEPEALDTDWLKKGVKVTTPKGAAEVRRITEDNGVYTSLGNFCRSELLEVDAEWVPEVGAECEYYTGKSYRKGEVLKIDKNGLFHVYAMFDRETDKLQWSACLRPIKTQREELIDIVYANNGNPAEFIVDAILSRFDLTEKDGE